MAIQDVRSDPSTLAVIGAAMEVHSVLGAGFLEAVYQEALGRELSFRGVPFRTEVMLPISFKGFPLSTSYRADLICFGTLLVELKAIRAIGRSELAQTLNYLKASRLPKGLLINFGASSLEYRRVILSAARTSSA